FVIFQFCQGQSMESVYLASPVFPGQGKEYQPVFKPASLVFFQVPLNIGFIGPLHPVIFSYKFFIEPVFHSVLASCPQRASLHSSRFPFFFRSSSANSLTAPSPPLLFKTQVQESWTSFTASRGQAVTAVRL